MHRIHSISEEEQGKKIKLSTDGKIIATLNGRHIINLWDTNGFQKVTSLTFQENVRDFALTPDRSKLAVITADDETGISASVTSQACIYDVSSQSIIAECPLPDVRSVIFLSNQGPLALGRLGRGTSDHLSNYIDFFDLELSSSGSVKVPEPDLPFELAILPNLGLLLSLGIGVAVWNLADKKLLRHIHCNNLPVDWDIWETTCFYALPQYNLLAVGFDSFPSKKTGPKICLFDVRSWRILGWYLEGLLYPTSVAISPDGTRIAATTKNSAYIWDAEIGSLLGECKVEGLSAVAFSPDNRYLITGASPPNSNVVWELPVQ